jgi:hypothetical protein
MAGKRREISDPSLESLEILTWTLKPWYPLSNRDICVPGTFAFQEVVY